ncbi:hypothetical protein HZ326_9287, partial [Fusarium oxysporum f. sp. albedinis]
QNPPRERPPLARPPNSASPTAPTHRSPTAPHQWRGLIGRMPGLPKPA